MEGWRLWGSSGQNVDDVLRYLDFPSDDLDLTKEMDDSEARLRIMEAMLRWRCGVPTAPDTICMPITPNSRHVSPLIRVSHANDIFQGRIRSKKTIHLLLNLVRTSSSQEINQLSRQL